MDFCRYYCSSGVVYRSFKGVDEYLKLITRRIQRVITQGPLGEKLNVAGIALKILKLPTCVIETG